MREQSGSSERIAASHGQHAKRLDAVKQPFAWLQVIDARRRRSNHVLADMFRVVHQAAISRMRLEFGAVRQIDGVRGNIIDGGEIVIAKRSKIRPAPCEQSAIGGERGQRDVGRKQVRQPLQECAIFGLSEQERCSAVRGPLPSDVTLAAERSWTSMARVPRRTQVARPKRPATPQLAVSAPADFWLARF